MRMDKTDVIIVGSGLAGLYCSLFIHPKLSVTFITKDNADISSSWLAQGGIAAAISPEDTPAIHMEDTLTAGAGLCNPEAVRILVDEGPGDIRILQDMHIPFDLNAEGDLAITREGGHTRNRVVHAGGDATGRETVKVLASIAAKRSNIRFLSHSFLERLVTCGNKVTGAIIWQNGEAICISARCVVLATGGIGQLYSRTTNPSIATGDGIAAASEAGAALEHMEFIQFHPTGLYDPRTPGRTFLITEALRGEGAVLVNDAGERFMDGRHPMGELAPRDIVARGIVSQMQQSQRNHVWLDARHIPAVRLKTRFPTVYEECMTRGIDITKDRIPVSPTQHYLVGGIRTDLNSQSTVNALFAIGECSCTGVHGANRLASNSMLECLVFGRRAAESINSAGLTHSAFSPPVQSTPVGSAIDFSEFKGRLRFICDGCAGVIRQKTELESGLKALEILLSEIGTPEWGRKEWCEAYNMAVTAKAVLEGALRRQESCGTHYRLPENTVFI